MLVVMAQLTGLYCGIGLSLLRVTLTKVEEPAAILRTLNQAMGGCRAGERYITLTLVLWERGSSRLRVANAGGKVVRIVRAGLSTPVEIPGQWLGWFPKAEYEGEFPVRMRE